MWSKSGPAHALDSLPSCALVQRSFMCADKSDRKEPVKHWNKGSQFFSTNASTDCFQYPIRTGIGWVLLARLPCLYASVNLWPTFMPFGPRAVRQACTAFMPFGLLVNHSAHFQAIWLAFKLFSLVSKQDHFALYNWKWTNRFKTGWLVYKQVAHLHTGQVCNWFTTYICHAGHMASASNN